MVNTGIILSAVGIAVIGLAFLNIPIGGGGGSTERVCDLVGTVNGKVHDDNVFKFIEVYDVNLSPTNCRDRGIFDFSLNSGSQAALFGTGYANIQVKAVDDSGGVARSVGFTITTSAGQIEKTFTQNVKLPTLVQGDTYTIQVNAPEWENGQIKFTEQVTV